MALRVLIFLFVLLLLVACGSGHEASRTQQNVGPDLATAFPRPSTLTKGVSGPPQDFQRYHNGANYYSPWPNHNLLNMPNEVTYQPSWNPQSPDVQDAAYATYWFQNFGGFSGKQRVKLFWNSNPGPPEANDVYVGLANQARDRWDWYRANGNQEAYFSQPAADYIDASEGLYLIVMLLGNTDAKLDYILVGDSYIPAVSIGADLENDPTLNVAPLTVNMFAYCNSYGSFITRVDWDWDGDGIWDLLDQTETTATHTFGPGTYTVKARAHDGEGATNIGEMTFIAINPANQLPTASFVTADPTSGTAPLAIHFDASGSTDPDGSIIKYEWDYDGHQGYDYTSTSPTADFIFGQKGQVEVALRVTDNDLATDNYFITVDVMTGWSKTLLDSNVSLADPESLARDFDIGAYGNANPRAGIVYHDQYSNRLRFLRATSISGSSWVPYVYPVTGNFTGYSPRIARLISGVPLVAYGQEFGVDVYKQWVVSATDFTATAWNSPIAIASGTNMGYDSDLQVINTLPAIAARTDGLTAQTNALKYVLCSDVDGTNWTQPALITLPGSLRKQVQLGISSGNLFKHPAVSFISDSGGNGPLQMRYMQSNDVDGTTWPSVYGWGTSSHYASLFSINGRPAWVGGLHTSNNVSTGLQYCRATDADGAAWPQPTQIGSGGDGELVVWNGKPAVVFVDRPTETVQLVLSQDADGTAWDPPYVVAALSSIMQARACAVDSSNLVITFYDGLHNDLYAAYWN